MNWWRDVVLAHVRQLLEQPENQLRIEGPRRERQVLVVGPTPPLIVGPCPEARQCMIIAPIADVVVAPVARAAWDDKGWLKVSESNGRAEFEGHFDVLIRSTQEQRRYLGRITQRGRQIATYIADPPAEIKRHPKGPCFALTQAPWFKVHWQSAPKDVDTAILYVERVLDEALNAR